MKRKLTILTTTLLLFLGGVPSLIAQSGEYITVRDFETWSSASLNYKLNNKVDIGLGQELRLKDNSSIVDKYFTNGTIDYKLSKMFTIGTELRYIRFNDNKGNIQGYENHFRYALHTSLEHDIKRLILKYRLQYQSQNELGLSSTEAVDPTQKLRFKIGGKYNIPKWKLDPRLSFEIYRTLGTVNDFTKFRMTLGTKVKIKKSSSIKLFYRMEKEMNELYPKTTNIFGLNYQFNLKRKKK